MIVSKQILLENDEAKTENIGTIINNHQREGWKLIAYYPIYFLSDMFGFKIEFEKIERIDFNESKTN